MHLHAALLPTAWTHAAEAALTVALAPAGQPLRAQVLAETLGLPPRYLEARLQRMVHAGLLRSVRGPRGGYALERSRESITLLDVVLAAEELDEGMLQAAHHAATPAATSPAATVLAGIWSNLSVRLLESLKRTTLEDLCLSAHRQRLTPGRPTRIDYAI